MGAGSTLAIFKINQQTPLSIEFPDIFSSCPNQRGKKGLFWKGAGRGSTLQGYYLVYIILTLLCFLLDLLTNKHMQGMELYDKLVDRFQGLSKENNPDVNKAKV